MKYALRLVGLPSLTLALETYQVWLLNNGIFPVTSGTFPLAREFQTLVGIAVGLAVLFCALSRPDLIKVRVVPPLAFACAVAGAGLLLCVPGNPAVVTAGLMLLSLAGAANHYLVGIAFAHADSPKRTSIGVACAVLVATLVTTVSPAPSFCASVVIDAVITLSVLLLLWREVFGMLARGHNGYHIRDELTLSYNTVKTHVKRIYRKLDVHSQQELIDLVESRCDV